MKTPIFAGIVMALSIAGWSSDAFAQNEPTPGPPPPNEAPLSEALHQTFTTQAWAAFRAGEFKVAIARADECIDRFGKTADGIEAILEKKKVDLPLGLPSEADKERIRQYQILHDVATCLLIKAWVAQKQGSKDEAIKAYARLNKYSYARVTERAGGPYWSPKEAAAEQVKRLSK